METVSWFLMGGTVLRDFWDSWVLILKSGLNENFHFFVTVIGFSLTGPISSLLFNENSVFIYSQNHRSLALQGTVLGRGLEFVPKVLSPCCTHFLPLIEMLTWVLFQRDFVDVTSCCCSVAKSYLGKKSVISDKKSGKSHKTFCDPMDCSTSGFPFPIS